MFLYSTNFNKNTLNFDSFKETAKTYYIISYIICFFIYLFFYIVLKIDKRARNYNGIYVFF